MGTRGTMAVKSENKTIRVYNHFDSYPTGLGLDFARFIAAADERELPGQIAAAQIVDESADAPADVLDTMKRAGIWQDVSSGTDWYSALRGAQGDFARYLELGYVPAWDSGDSEEWGYLADFDEAKLYITSSGEPHTVLNFVDIPADIDDLVALMARIESE